MASSSGGARPGSSAALIMGLARTLSLQRAMSIPAAPKQAAGQLARMLPVQVCRHAGDDRRAISLAVLEQSLPAGGQVADDSRHANGERIQVDDVEVRLHAAGDHAAV